MKAIKRQNVRLQPPTEIEELLDVIGHANDNGFGPNSEGVVELRPRTSGKEGDWAMAPKDHLFNSERYNYRIGESPRIYLEDGEVHTSEGSVSIKQARALVALQRRVHKTKKSVNIDQETDENPTGGEFSVTAEHNGMRVGCEWIDRDDIEAFAKSQGW